MLSGVMLWLAFAGHPPEALALCTNDVYCAFYTDATLTDMCGERNSCINCSSVN